MAKQSIVVDMQWFRMQVGNKRMEQEIHLIF